MNKKTKKILSYAICFIMITVLSISGYSRDVKAETNNKYIAVSTGPDDAVALKSDGTVWAWGNNSNGQLGNGSTINSNIPMPVIGLDNVKIVAISAATYHTVALDSNGKVWSWGKNDNGQLGSGSNISSNIPVPVIGLDSVKIVAISAGFDHTVALDSNGKVWSWGFNGDGQLGSGSNISSNIPVPVMGLDNVKVTAISAGYDNTVALDSDGRVWSWGNNGYGQLGSGSNISSNIPVPVIGLDNVKVTAISAGWSNAAAVDSDGKLWSWGFNANGELANSSITNRSSNMPVPATELDNVKITAVSVEGSYIEALDSNGGVWEWGGNTYRNIPTRKAELDNVKITAVSSGNVFAEALDANGELWSWGLNDSGELGIGNNIRSNVPVNMNDADDAFYVSLVKASLDIGDISSVTQNLTLPTEGANGTSIAWISDDTTTISNTGVVTRPAAGSGNKSVNLTATITKGAHIDTKTFTVTVIRKPAAIFGVTPVSSGIYKAGDSLAFKVSFDNNINVTGEPYLPISFGNTTKMAKYSSGSGTTDLTFAYTVQAGDNANNNEISTGNMLQLNGGSIIDAGLRVPCDLTINNVVPFNIIVDTTPPTFNSSTGAALDINNKKLTLSFSENIANACADLNTLKSNITFSSDGTSFNALSANDTIAIENGKLVITFDKQLIGTNNKIKIAANSLKDAAGNIKTDETKTSDISEVPPIPTGITLNLKFTGPNDQVNTVMVQNFNFTSSTASNGLKQYEFNLSQNQVGAIGTAAVEESSVDIMDGSNNIIGTVEFPNNVISQIDLSTNVNTSFPVTIIGKGNFPSQNYITNLIMTTLGTNKHFKVSFTKLTVPDAPTNVTAAAGNGYAVVSFIPPVNNGGSAITGYKVISDSGIDVGTGTGSPITVTGLTNGVTYNFSVKAVNVVGDSAKSNTISVTPAAPYIPPYIQPVPQPVTETRTVPVTVGVGNNEFTLGNVTVVRTINTNGTINDTVSLDGSTVSQIIPNVLNHNATSLDISLGNLASGAANSVEFQADGNSMNLMQENGISLNISAPTGSLSLPSTTLAQLTGRTIQATFSATSDSRTPSIISQYAAGATPIGAPLKLDTNFSGAAVITMPITLDELQSANGGANLAVMVQHSDGENEIVQGDIVRDSNNNIVGERIPVEKFSTFTLIKLPDSASDGNAKVVPYKVNSDKVWTVNFSNNIDGSTVNKDNVYVVDDEGNKVDVKLEVDGKALIISPIENYKSGHKYQLYIGEKVQSVNKKTLKKALEYEFNVI